MKQENSNATQDLWKMRLRMTQQLVFSGIQHITNHAQCPLLKAVMMRKWFGGFDNNQLRMLPDGTQTQGAPTKADLEIRNEIVNAVFDGLKQRPRNGESTPRALFKLALHEYDFLLSLTQLYFKSEEFIAADQVNVYEASSLETTIYAILHVSRADDLVEVFKPLDEQDLQACSI